MNLGGHVCPRITYSLFCIQLPLQQQIKFTVKEAGHFLGVFGIIFLSRLLKSRGVDFFVQISARGGYSGSDQEYYIRF